MMGNTVNTKAGMLKIFSSYKESKEETEDKFNTRKEENK